jgi:hypothetical protein
MKTMVLLRRKFKETTKVRSQIRVLLASFLMIIDNDDSLGSDVARCFLVHV